MALGAFPIVHPKGSVLVTCPMGKIRVIWSHEVRQANKIARSLMDTGKIQFGWRILLLPNYLVNYVYFRKNLYLARKNFLFTKGLAFNASQEILRGESRASKMRLIEVRTRDLLDREKKGFYGEKVRRKQLHEIELLIDHYLGLLKSNGETYEEIIKESYQSKESYLSFLNRLQRAEQEVIKAAIRTMKRGSKQERVNWFGKVDQAFKRARMEEMEAIFP